jgi:hypothetical protein
VNVIDRSHNHTRSYRNKNGYTPKNYATRPRTAAFLKLEKLKAEKEEQARLEEERKAREAAAQRRAASAVRRLRSTSASKKQVKIEEEREEPIVQMEITQE